MLFFIGNEGKEILVRQLRRLQGWQSRWVAKVAGRKKKIPAE